MSRPWRPRSQPASVAAAWQHQLERAQQQPWLFQELLSHGPELFSRFQQYYQHLRALPRKTRRALQSKLARSLAGAALLLALSPQSGLALPIVVNEPTDQLLNDTNCTLREAIIAANTDTAYYGCATGGGPDTITFANNNTYTLTLTGTGEDLAATGDLDIKEALTITGNGEANTIIDGNQSDRVFDIHNQATVTIEELTVRNGSITADGGGHSQW